MIELSDTIPLMTSSDYKERFKAEYLQLKIRTLKLATFVEKYSKGELDFRPSCTLELLTEQLTVMRNCLSILERRAEIECVDLDEDGYV